MRIRAFIFYVALISYTICLAGCAVKIENIAGFKNLVQLSLNNKTKEKSLKIETANFKRLKKYIDSDKLKKGVSAKYTRKKFGEPLLITTDSKWVYKPANASWIEGEKIYLMFDENGLLTNWECDNCLPIK